MPNTKLAIIALAVIAGLALLICLFLLWKVYDLQKRYEQYVIRTSSSNSGKPIESFGLGNALKNSNSAKRYIKELVCEEVSNIMRHPSKGLIENISDAVYEDIRHLFELNKKEAAAQSSNNAVAEPAKPSESPKKETQEETPRDSNSKMYYASALEEDNKTFYNVSEEPVPDETVFLFIETKNGKCDFAIYEGARSKVLKDDSFLTGACQLARIGNSKVVVTEKGIAELTTDNKWVVTKPAKVTFE